LAPYFLIVQSEELLLLKPVIFTKSITVHDLAWRKCSSFSLYPQKFGCTPKNEGKRVHVPPDEKTCGHAAENTMVKEKKNKKKNNDPRNTTQKTKN
jgi:hypothetical protein